MGPIQHHAEGPHGALDLIQILVVRRDRGRPPKQSPSLRLLPRPASGDHCPALSILRTDRQAEQVVPPSVLEGEAGQPFEIDTLHGAIVDDLTQESDHQVGKCFVPLLSGRGVVSGPLAVVGQQRPCLIHAVRVLLRHWPWPPWPTGVSALCPIAARERRSSPVPARLRLSANCGEPRSPQRVADVRLLEELAERFPAPNA
jgi:hypothetical protein